MTVKRIVTAAALIPMVIAAVWWGPVSLVAALVGLVTFLALFEFFRLGEQAGLHGYPRWTTLCALALLYAQWAAGGIQTQPFSTSLTLVRITSSPVIPLEAVLLIFALGTALLGVAGKRAVGEILPGIAVSAAGLIFIALPLSYLVRLDAIERQGPRLLLFLLVLVWVGDTTAYFVGTSLGHLKMAPVLSPKKTWEGAAGNLLGSLVVALVAARWLELSVGSLLATAALANVAGQLGDLLESAYKRGAGAKDSGLLLPGHGGMLDRIDSLVFAAPVAWWYVCWVTRSTQLF
jgi:phosphatidate cytidylyltransferase